MEERLRQLVSDIFDIEQAKISPELTPEDIEKWESLNHLRLITSVEKEFGIRFSMSDIESIDCLGALERLVEEHV